MTHRLKIGGLLIFLDKGKHYNFKGFNSDMLITSFRTKRFFTKWCNQAIMLLIVYNQVAG
jgi:hypothetical protein